MCEVFTLTLLKRSKLLWSDSLKGNQEKNEHTDISFVYFILSLTLICLLSFFYSILTLSHPSCRFQNLFFFCYVHANIWTMHLFILLHLYKVYNHFQGQSLIELCL
jgi:hypothetical protein